jgi:hypothetical protein
MAEVTLENGQKAKCTEEEFILGLKVNNIKVCIIMISNKDMGLTDGKMEKGILEIGRIINVTVKASLNI